LRSSQRSDATEISVGATPTCHDVLRRLAAALHPCTVSLVQTLLTPGVATVALAMLAATSSVRTATAGGEIFRCIDSGHVTYSDRECGPASVVLAQSGDFAGVNVSRGGASAVEIGMSPRMVQQAMGRPRETVATLEGHSLVEYWIWRDATATTRVAFREGRVSRVDVR
jgi:hypothetical protein